MHIYIFMATLSSMTTSGVSSLMSLRRLTPSSRYQELRIFNQPRPVRRTALSQAISMWPTRSTNCTNRVWDNELLELSDASGVLINKLKHGMTNHIHKHHYEGTPANIFHQITHDCISYNCDNWQSPAPVQDWCLQHYVESSRCCGHVARLHPQPAAPSHKNIAIICWKI